jgi:hypothetical protein
MELKMIKSIVLISTIAATLSACSPAANIASRNLSRAADEFEVNRRIVFYNGITGEYMLTVQGLCALGNDDKPRQLSITCKTGPTAYKKHFLGLSDNVSYMVEHLEANTANTYHYRVIFKPQSVLPDVDFRGSTDAIVETVK